MRIAPTVDCPLRVFLLSSQVSTQSSAFHPDRRSARHEQTRRWRIDGGNPMPYNQKLQPWPRLRPATAVREYLHRWCGPWSSKPVGGLNKAPSGFDSHILPLVDFCAVCQCFPAFARGGADSRAAETPAESTDGRPSTAPSRFGNCLSTTPPPIDAALAGPV